MSMLILVVAVLAFKPAITLLADGLATMIAAGHIWQSRRLRRQLLAIGQRPATWERSTTRHRRLLARGLSNSVRMTAHFSLFPYASLRANAVVNWLARKN